MFTPRESTLLLDMNQRLRTLYIQKLKAQQSGDQARVDDVQAKIDNLMQDCEKVINAADAI